MRTVPLRSAALLLLALVTAAFAQDLAAFEFQRVELAPGLHVLAGGGGNVAVLVGDDGVLLVDAAVEQVAGKLAATVKGIADKPVRYLINTHWHFDHVGGNEVLAKAGAVIVAHENVRRRMSTPQHLRHIDRDVSPAAPQALPAVTFRETLTLHFAGQEVQLIHVEPAHTDGDVLAYFPQANVLHTGDVVFNGMYPFIDVNAGGSLDGMVRAVDRVLAVGNEQTRFIPGHGPIAKVADLRKYREMLVTVGDRIRALMKEGKSRDEIIAAKPTADFDAEWGGGGFPPDLWVGIVHDGMQRE